MVIVFKLQKMYVHMYMYEAQVFEFVATNTDMMFHFVVATYKGGK